MTLHTDPLGALAASGYIRQSRLLAQVVPVSSATLWRWVKAATFPQPVKLSGRVTAWRTEDVRQWMQSRDDAAPHCKRRAAVVPA